VKVTAEHPIATPDGWLQAYKLRESSEVIGIAPEVKSANVVDCGYVLDSVTCLSTFGSRASRSISIGGGSPAEPHDNLSLLTLSRQEWNDFSKKSDHSRCAAVDNNASSGVLGRVATIGVAAKAIGNANAIDDFRASFEDWHLAIRNGDLTLDLPAARDVEADEAFSVDDSGEISKVSVLHVDTSNSQHFLGTVYNLVTEDSTFFVDGILTHNCSHFLEHLTQQERVHFANELYRVLVPGVYQGGAPVAGFARIITPHWCAARAYGDPTHRWPPVSEWMYYYWNRIWRMGDPAMGAGPNAPHADMEHNPEGYNCDFDWNIAGSFNPALMVKSDGFKQDAVQWFKEAFQDTIATMTSRKKV
jgi:hypothetical protein